MRGKAGGGQAGDHTSRNHGSSDPLGVAVGDRFVARDGYEQMPYADSVLMVDEIEKEGAWFNRLIKFHTAGGECGTCRANWLLSFWVRM